MSTIYSIAYRVYMRNTSARYQCTLFTLARRAAQRNLSDKRRSTFQIGTGQVRSVQESPFFGVNRSPIWHGIVQKQPFKRIAPLNVNVVLSQKIPVDVLQAGSFAFSPMIGDCFQDKSGDRKASRTVRELRVGHLILCAGL